MLSPILHLRPDLVKEFNKLDWVLQWLLVNARIIESITALLVGVNRRYKITTAGIRVTGLAT